MERIERGSLCVGKENLVVFSCSQGFDVRAVALKLSRHAVAFEVYAPSVMLQRSESLPDFKILLDDVVVYSGRAVVTDLVHASSVTVAEAKLDNGWQDVALLGTEKTPHLRDDLEAFLRSSLNPHHIVPEFKLAVADMQVFLSSLKAWLEQVELNVRAQPSGDRRQTEMTALQELAGPVIENLEPYFERFETTAQSIEKADQPIYAAYAKQQLHALVLCAPFMYRTFQKPLGYAGDYEMVNMMVRDPFEGGSLFAKMLNAFFLATPPVVAHRNRLARLVQLMTEEACRVVKAPAPFRVFNLGCGPAIELQQFLTESKLSQNAEFMLVDFSDEAIQYAGSVLENANRGAQRLAKIQLVKKSVTQLFKDASKPVPRFGVGAYDLVYCAGLYDYLARPVCSQLTNLLYKLVAPGGLLVLTNVDDSNPSRGWMEFSVDWHLFYRSHNEMVALRPAEAPLEACQVWAEPSGVNLFLEIRKPNE